MFGDSTLVEKNIPPPAELSLLPASAGFPLVLFFKPEDRGSMFLQNARLSLNYMVLQPRRPYSL
jgi:hypothetical protein